MTLTDSLRRFRLVSPLVPPPAADERADRAAATAHLWLDPRVFADLDPAEVPGLTAPERAALRGHAERFTAVAEEARAAGGPTRDQITEARDHFAAARELIDRRLGDPAAAALTGHLDRLLRDGRLPPWVLGVGVRTGPDHYGDPAVFVDFVTPTGAVDDSQTYRRGIRFRDAVRDVQRTHLPQQADHELYINYRPESGVTERLDGLPE